MNSVTNPLSNDSKKRTIPLRIFVYMCLVFLLPFIMYIPLNVFIGGLTFDECMDSGNNFIAMIFMSLGLIIPFIFYLYLNKAVKEYVPGDEALTEKINKKINMIEMLSIVFPIILCVLNPVIVTKYNLARGFTPVSFKGESYMYFCFCMIFGGLCIFSVFFYILYVATLEKTINWLPYKRDYMFFSFIMRCLLISFFVLLGMVLMLEAVFDIPVNREMTMAKLFSQKVLPFALLVGFVGLADMYIELKELNTCIRLIGTFSSDLSNKNYQTKDIPIFIRCELGELANHLNSLRDSTKELLIDFKSSIDSTKQIAENLGHEMLAVQKNVESVNSGIDTVNNEMKNQSSGVEETGLSVNHIIEKANALNASIEGQVSAVTQSSSAVEEMVANVNSVTEILNQNTNAVKELTHASDDGRQSVDNAVNIAQQIIEQSESLMEATTIIQTIASQTNLLAMNAAIESAHAGEAGKGFAVVADEIRKLAEQSSMQGKNINSNLKALSASIQQVSVNTKDVQEKFNVIYDLAQTVMKQEAVVMNAMSEQAEGNKQVLDAIKDINHSTSDVKDGSIEMVAGSEQIVKEMSNLSEVTGKINSEMAEMAESMQGITAAMNNVSKSSEINQKQMAVLSEQIGNFKL